MLETYIGPSELHLKKELTALPKSRFLRDPETCTSWRSPLRSRSFGTNCNLNYGNENIENQKGGNNSSGSHEITSRFEKRRKKVYLYNWGHHSSKSSDSGLQSDEDNRQVSVQDGPEEVLNNTRKIDSRSDTCLEDPVNIHGVRGTNPETPVRRTARKSRRKSASKKRITKNSATAKMLNLPSSSLGVLKSLEQSDDSGYFSSEDLQHLKDKLTRKISCPSHCASPLFSGSACGNLSNSSKILKNARREGSSHSYTPASNSSHNRYRGRNPSTVGSWDGYSASFDGDEVDQLDLRRNRGCGIPCYWSKRTKDPGSRSWSSLSQSDTPSRTVRSILCGSRTVRRSSHKHKYEPKSSQGLPLLTNSFDGGGGSSADSMTDELTNNFGELDLEAVSRLDGRRWSCCRSQEGLELGLPEGFESEMMEQRSLSQKYRPRSFDEILGHNIVVQSLTSAILRGRISPAYLFQGPRGTGKTSVALVFAAALNCLSTEENRPCGLCSECTNFSTGNGSNMREVDATNKKDICRIRLLLKKMPISTTFSRYKVFVIDECHMLSSKSCSAFMKFLEEPVPRVVFIFITIAPDSLPRAMVSRCQKYLFPKIKDADITFRLRKLSAEENLDIELDALDLIALNSDGSLQYAETMLDQLSLLGKRITASLVNDLVGVVSDEKLLDLLDIALSSDTAETMKRSRELMDSGVDPVALMSQLAGLLMDIIAGNYRLPNSQSSGRVLVTEAEMERLQQALKILSDAEKQLRLSSERSTWFTAALLQLGSWHSPQPTPSSSSSRQITKRFNEDVLEKTKESSSFENKSNPSLKLQESSSVSIPQFTCGHYSISSHRSLLDATYKDDATGKRVLRCVSPDKLDGIWRRCIERCNSEILKQLLYAYGKLVSITETEGALIAYIAFGDGNIKSRAERFLSSITDSIAIVLRHNVEVRIELVPDKYLKALESVPGSPSSQHSEINAGKVDSDRIHGSSDKDRHARLANLPRRSVDYSENKLRRKPERLDNSLAQRTNTTAIDEQRLQSAWLQSAEKGEVPLVSQSNHDKNHSLPQNGATSQNQSKCFEELSISFKHWEDGVSNEIEEIETIVSRGYHMEQVGGRVERYQYAISPSLLHSNSFRANFDQENLGYESGPVRSGLCCWKTRKHHRGKVKQGNHLRSHRAGSLLCFGQCGTSKANR